MLNIKSNGFESENDSKYHQVMGTSNVAEQENVNFIIKIGVLFWSSKMKEIISQRVLL